MRNKFYRNIFITFVSTIDAEIAMEHSINIYSLDSPSEVTRSLVSSEIIFLQKSRGDLAFYVEANFQRLSGIVENEMHGHFIYMPYLAEEVIRNRKHIYYLPDLNCQESPLTFKEENLWALFDIPKECTKALILGCTDVGEVFIYSLDDVLPSDLDSAIQHFCRFLHDCNDEVFESSTSSFYEVNDEKDFADSEFETEVNRLSEEIIANINRLRAIGISEVVIKQLFDGDQKLSRLVVTDDYRIILPDYNNMEIHLEPLPKAVYLLFLKHPEGIRFKDLPSYRTELAQIYLNVTNRNDLSAAYQSILSVTDPTKNSINEKCSRIKEAFVSRFDDNLARYYYINGSAREPKVIKLERSMIINTNNR